MVPAGWTAAAPWIFRKRQNSGRPGAHRRNFSRPQSHLRAVIAMIGMKSPGLDGGEGEGAKTRTRSWGRAIPAYYLDGGRSSQGRHRGERDRTVRRLRFSGETRKPTGKLVVWVSDR